MTKTRVDAWTTREDELLVDTVLKCISEGEVILGAFAEVGEKTDRTSAACGYRWYSTMYHEYLAEVRTAKKEGLKIRNLRNKRYLRG